ncbi:MAG: hypothetical protein SGJ11_00610 [Phycisphaerae bacterium]|nr:hypothetical protein [Phycisphaerae bacterium]
MQRFARILCRLACAAALAPLVITSGAVGCGDGASAGTCPLYTTGFDSFAGPPDFTQGQFSVQWCLNTSAVSTSNFCATGSALKLDSSTDDPVLLVHVGDAPCASVSVSFNYGQFASSNTVLKAGTTSATTVVCAPSTPTTIGSLSTTGGQCTQVSFTVLLNGAKGVVFKFDHGANSNAITIDDFSVSVTGCCSAMHGCCETGTMGCDAPAVESCVCAVDPFCCAVEWDQLCVDEVESLGCGSCGAVRVPCLEAFATDFGTLYQASSVCQLFPALFESCEGAPPTLTISGDCAGTADPALRFGTGFPHSAAITRCIDLTVVPSPILGFRFSRDLGTLGPRIDFRVDGGDWIVAWQPASGQGTDGCSTVELNLATIANETNVQFRFTSASSVANGARFDDLLLTSGALPHDCCTAGAAGCATEPVETCVCALDAYCCETAWDEVCIEIAAAECRAGCEGIVTCGAPSSGSCLDPHATPFCNDEACCTSICSFDPFCCAVAWDALCASSAAAACAVTLPADLDANGLVNAADLAVLLASWGATGGTGGAGAADFDHSGAVDAADLAVLLAAWTG